MLGSSRLKGKGRKEVKDNRKEDNSRKRVKGNKKRVSLKDLKGELGGEVVVSEGDDD